VLIKWHIVAHAGKRWVQVFVFEARVALELLDEVAVPKQPRLKRLQRLCSPLLRCALPLPRHDPRTRAYGGRERLPQRQRAVRQMRADARTRVRGRQR
jgi:hypothetical protein